VGSGRQGYYWHRFYAHQPDLNFDNPDVHKMLMKVIDFWLDLGVDGMRLDAVPYLRARRHHCENLPETHAFLKKPARARRRALSRSHAARGSEPVARRRGGLFGGGDECHMTFTSRSCRACHVGPPGGSFSHRRHLAPDAVDPGQLPVGDVLAHHDELTLEMVTDEDRDYMYRVYARIPTRASTSASGGGWRRWSRGGARSS